MMYIEMLLKTAKEKMIMNKNKKVIDNEVLKSVAGGQTEEEYYAELAKFGLLDTEEHLLNGKKCGDCNMGKLSFLRYQPGPFGNKEAVYYCNLCHEYTVTGLRK